MIDVPFFFQLRDAESDEEIAELMTESVLDIMDKCGISTVLKACVTC